jgi:excinuclease ABC subunit C
MFGDREFLDISKDKALADLGELLGLKKPLKRIEGYDISHHGGANVVASMVVFTNGVSDRAEYRKFKMTKQRNDDTGNMHETLFRRFSDKNKSWGMPDLIVIDGGKGQLEAAIKALRERSVQVPVFSIMKREEELLLAKNGSYIATEITKTVAKNKAGVGMYEDEKYLTLNLHAGQRNAGTHSKNLRGNDSITEYSDITKLLQRLRDESHRFAVSYHTVLKRTNSTKSILEEIPGIGPATRKKLLKAFGSVRALKDIPEKEIASVVGSDKAAKIVQSMQ